MRGQVPHGRAALLLNLDETAVPFWHGDVRGNLLVRKRRFRDADEPVQRVSRRQRRSNITHVAVIADRPDVQRVLPQWFLGNGSVLRARDLAVLQPDLPRNVRFVRGASSWTSVDSTARLMTELGRALRPWVGTHQPVLLMDCARQHLHIQVARAARRAGLWLAYIPAGLTWLLQPCDTHLFLAYKRYLRAEYARLRAEHPRGEVDAVPWLRVVAGTVPHVLEGESWAHAFREDGYTAGQAGVSAFVRRQLGPGAHTPALSSEPSADTIARVLPRGCAAPHAALLGPARARAVPALMHADDAEPETEPPERPWAGRLRSSSRASLALEDPGVPPPLPPPAAPPPPVLPPTVPWQRRAALRAAPAAATGSPEHGPSPSGGHPCPQDGPISARTRSRSFARSSAG